MIDLNTLRYFTSAFETGTFSHAAKANGVSQPTVSAAVQKLEGRLGRPLFQRSKSGLKPLPLAVTLYHDVVDSVVHLASLEARLLNEPKHSLRIYCAPDMLMNRLAIGLKNLSFQIPSVQLSFTEDARDCDLAYVTDRCIPEAHSFTPLVKEKFKVAVAKNHPLATFSEIQLSDLQSLPLIHRPYCSNADRKDLSAMRRSSAAQATNDQQLLDLIAAGLGVSFVPESHGQARDDIVLLTLKGVDAGERQTGISFRRTARAKEFAQQLVQSGL